MGSHEEDVGSKSESTTEELKNGNNDSVKNDSKPSSPLPKSVTSRYGRIIKPKSPITSMLEFPKNLKMPKTIVDESPTEDISVKMEDTSSIMEDSSNSNNTDVSLKISEEKLDIEDLQSKCQWSLGQLVWARIGGYPYWPGIVTLDPLTMSYVSQRGGIKNVYTLHVRYCADKDRHSWVSFRNVINYEGVDHFEKLSKDKCTEKKRPQYAPGFVIKPSLKPKWDDAVAEADKLKTKSLEQRIELFKPKKKKRISSENSSNSEEKLKETGRKRKLSSSNEEVLTKKPKSDMEEFHENGVKEETDLDIKDAKSTLSSITLETPPTPPLSNKDSSDEASTLKVRKVKRRSGKEGVFEVFCERNREMAEQIDPNATQEDIQEYLSELWDSMNPQERSKYRADYLKPYDVDDEDEDVDSDGDDQSSIRRHKAKHALENGEISDGDEFEKSVVKQKSKLHSKTKVSSSDQEDSTSVESDNLEKSVRKRRSKVSRDSSDQDDMSSSDGKFGKKRKSKIEKGDESPNGDKDESSFIMGLVKKSKQNKLFKGLKNERVCQLCEEPGKIVRCKGPCYSYYHLSCAKPGESPEPSEAGDENEAFKEDIEQIQEKLPEKVKETVNKEADEDDDYFKCIDCLSGVAPPCFSCQERGKERIKCSVPACGKHYHPDCLKSWPQAFYQSERLHCPYHICHTCISDNPQSAHHPRSSNEKFVRCVRCPSTYHASASCLPAGSHLITGSQIICPKHYKSSTPPVNVTWCFICALGGSLICCDTCPTSFHEECLGISAPDGDYICEDCETGRLPLYGEVVWVKLGTYRWWPSFICFPQDVPSNIANKPHKTGEFCVLFLGSRDYYWVHRGRVFLYHDGDDRTKVIGNKKVEESYKKAVEEAKILYERLMSEKASVTKGNGTRPLKPPPYVKLKINKPVGNVKIPEPDSIVACECSASNPNPCSPQSDCLNRILMIECSPDVCPAGSKCQNQMFAQRKYPSMKPFHTEGRGWGLKALEIVYEGQFVIEYVGEVIDEAEYRLRLQQKRERKNDDYYFLTIDNNRMIDAEPKGNLSRFMNHSCQPNCETQKWTVNGDTRVGLFALRDILPGEELTFNYNLASDGETRKPCLCNAPNCSGFIGLKVTKPQISIAQQKKIEKAEKVKRQRRQKKVPNCWGCSLKIDSVEDSYRCDQKTCGKTYHKYCIEENDDQVFHCPWHFCAECHKRTTLRCNYCCNAFCQIHTHGNLRENLQNGTYVCHNHATEFKDIGSVELNGAKGEALMDDDECDKDCTAHHNNCNEIQESVKPEEIKQEIKVEKEDETVEKPVSTLTNDTAAVEAPRQLDETLTRGSIVEVLEDTISEDESPRKKRQRKKLQREAESDLTHDQIAAIIGI